MKEKQVLMRWDYKKHQYKKILRDSKWLYKTFSFSDKTKVNCCNCNKCIQFGDSYTSLEYHNDLGIGYAICDRCYNKELERRKKYK